jgi:hypothetical protein
MLKTCPSCQGEQAQVNCGEILGRATNRLSFGNNPHLARVHTLAQIPSRCNNVATPKLT